MDFLGVGIRRKGVSAHPVVDEDGLDVCRWSGLNDRCAFSTLSSLRSEANEVLGERTCIVMERGGKSW